MAYVASLAARAARCRRISSAKVLSGNADSITAETVFSNWVDLFVTINSCFSTCSTTGSSAVSEGCVSVTVSSVARVVVLVFVAVKFLRMVGAERVVALVRVAAFAISQITNSEANTVAAVINFEKNLSFFFIRPLSVLF